MTLTLLFTGKLASKGVHRYQNLTQVMMKVQYKMSLVALSRATTYTCVQEVAISSCHWRSVGDESQCLTQATSEEWFSSRIGKHP